MTTKISDVIINAFELVISRNGDVDTEDGSFATCGTDEIIRLDEAMAHYFQVGSDDISLSDAYVISQKAKELDLSHELITKQAEQVKVLREALSGLVSISFDNEKYLAERLYRDFEESSELISAKSALEATKD